MYNTKRGSAKYIVREVREVRERGRERERERERNDDFPQKETTPGINTCVTNGGKVTHRSYNRMLQLVVIGREKETVVHWWKALVHDGEHILLKISAVHLAGFSVSWCLLTTQCLALWPRNGHLNDVGTGRNARSSLAARNPPSSKLRSRQHRKLTNQQNR